MNLTFGGGGAPMGLDDQPPSRWRPIRVPMRIVESAYGRDNHDNAGDDMAFALRQVSEWADQYRYRFGFDTTHLNPWYHAMVFEVEGVPDPVFARLIELLKGHGLVPDVE